MSVSAGRLVERAAAADALVETWAKGVMEALGIDPESDHACGPADLLPLVRWAKEDADKLRAIRDPDVSTADYLHRFYPIVSGDQGERS